jgi:hypothetical protein
VDALRNADDSGIWLLSGAILSDLSRMVDQQQGEAPALGVDAPSQQKDVIPPLLPDSWFREEESSK